MRCDCCSNQQTVFGGNVADGSKAVLTAPKHDFRSSPNNRHEATAAAFLKGAINGLMHCKYYSITSSTTASSAGGIVRPIALAVLRLMTNSNFVGACTGTPLVRFW